MATIRAYRMEAPFTALSDQLMERNAHAFVTQKLASGWLACRLDMLGLLVLTLAGKGGFCHWDLGSVGEEESGGHDGRRVSQLRPKQCQFLVAS